jgi:hypothetical protein
MVGTTFFSHIRGGIKDCPMGTMVAIDFRAIQSDF